MTQDEPTPNDDAGIDLTSLPRETTPPPDLEDRVVSALTTKQLLGTRRGTRVRLLVAIAASVMAFVAGYGVAVQRAGPSDVAAERAKFALLLYEGDRFAAAPADDVDRHRQVYAAWANELAGRGVLTDAGELAAGRWVLEAAGPGVEASTLRDPVATGTPTGFFIVVADDEAQALEIARSHPHLANGGQVALRQIVNR